MLLKPVNAALGLNTQIWYLLVVWKCDCWSTTEPIQTKQNKDFMVDWPEWVMIALDREPFDLEHNISRVMYRHVYISKIRDAPTWQILKPTFRLFAQTLLCGTDVDHSSMCKVMCSWNYTTSICNYYVGMLIQKLHTQLLGQTLLLPFHSFQMY